MLRKMSRARVAAVAATVLAVTAAGAGLASSASATTPPDVTTQPTNGAYISGNVANFAGGAGDYDTTAGTCRTIALIVGSTAETVNTTPNGDGTTCSWTASTEALADGPYTWSVTADGTEFGSGSFSVNTTPPHYPTVSAATGDLVVGGTASINVSAEPGAQLLERVNGDFLWTDITGQTTRTYALDHEGFWQVDFKAHNNAGDSPISPVSFTVASGSTSTPTPTPTPTASASPTAPSGPTPSPTDTTNSPQSTANLSITLPPMELGNYQTVHTDLTFGVHVDPGAVAEFSLDNSYWSPVTGSSVSLSFAVGAHRLYFRVADTQGGSNWTWVDFTVVQDPNATPTSDPTSTPLPTQSADPTPSTDPTPTQSAQPTSTADPTQSADPTPVASETASAQPTSSQTPEASASETPVASVTAGAAQKTTSGGTVTVSYSGFTPGEKVEVWVHSTPILLFTATADASGTVSAQVTLPAGLELGAHQVILKGLTSGIEYVTPVTVSASSGTLPQSGFNVAAPLLLGIALLAAGAGVLAARRRKGARIR